MYLVGDRIIIRDFLFEDVNDVYEYSKKEYIGPQAGWKPHESKEITRHVISGYIINNESFAIVLKEKKKVIGNISIYLTTFRKKVKACELGFVLNDKYWGYGFMTEAVKLVLKYVFDILNVEIVSVGHYTTNLKSKKTIENCGFTFEGIFRKYKRIYNGDLIDAAMYSMTKEEYEDKYRKVNI